MSNTPVLNLPYLAAGQAQKHVTLNEGLRMLDALVQLAVVSRAVANPPATPAEGDRYIVPASPGGAWALHGGTIAAFQDGGWIYFTPRLGWLAWIADEHGMFAFNGTTWVACGGNPQSVEQLGINATADTTNRLSVSSAATLFNHAGSGHQLKINKAAATGTASLMFQTGFSGRAEIGTAGNDQLAIKTSLDGTNWSSSVTIHPTNGMTVGPHQFGTSFANGTPLLEAAAGITGDRYAFMDFHASDSQPDYSARINRTPGANGNLLIENVGTGDVILTSGGKVSFNTAGVDRIKVATNGDLYPAADNASSLGKSGARFSSVWAVNGVIQTSDMRDKTIHASMRGQDAVAMVEAVEPVFYRWKNGGETVEVVSETQEPLNPDNPSSKSQHVVKTVTRSREGRRLHAGFRAQDVRRALDSTGLEFAVWGLENSDDPGSRQWLRPDQLIPVLWAALRETRAELSRLATSRKA